MLPKPHAAKTAWGPSSYDFPSSHNNVAEDFSKNLQ